MPAALLALAGALYLIASSSGAGWLYTIPATLVAVLLVSAIGPLYSLRGIEVRRVSPATATAGRPLRCTLEVSNTGRLPRHLLEIQDNLAGGEGGIVVPRVKGSQTFRVEYEIAGSRRGVYEGGEMLLASSSPFGLIYSRRRVEARSPITVRPHPLEVAELPNALESAGGDGEEAEPHRGSGEELWGTREYRPGDPARLVAWRKSARTMHAGGLTVTEFAHNSIPPLSVSIDLNPTAPEEARETAISVAASFMLRALAEGRGVTAQAGPQSLPFPEEPSPAHVLDWCAALEPAWRTQGQSADITVLPTLRNLEIPETGMVVLVSCHSLEGKGAWMSQREEKDLVAGLESAGKGVIVVNEEPAA